MLPFTGASLYLGRRPDAVRADEERLLATKHGSVHQWRDVLWMNFALDDAKKAASLVHNEHYFEPEFGNSWTATFAWMRALESARPRRARRPGRHDELRRLPEGPDAHLCCLQPGRRSPSRHLHRRRDARRSPRRDAHGGRRRALNPKLANRTRTRTEHGERHDGHAHRHRSGRHRARAQDHRGAVGVLMALFFAIGFLTCLNDIIIPHFKAIFALDYTRAMLVQFSFFAAYFVVSDPLRASRSGSSATSAPSWSASASRRSAASASTPPRRSARTRSSSGRSSSSPRGSRSCRSR